MSTATRMSEADALAEARKRFGPSAVVWATPSSWQATHRVGILRPAARGCKRTALGWGKCWERAFLHAEKRASGLSVPGRKAKHAPAPSLFGQEGRR